tara:strand:+ start:43 stop:2181 length:2139 start_codon:yes stop_codon:yes gene_type:complete
MAVKFSQFDGTITPVKTSETQFIVGFEGTTNAKWTMKALADEIGGSAGDTIFTTSPTSTVPTGQVIKLTDYIKFESVSGAAYGGWVFKTALAGAGANEYATISYGARTFLSHYRANEGWAFGGTNTTNSFHFNTGTTTMSDGWSMRVHGGTNGNGALIVKGSGNTSATYGLRVQNSDNVDYIKAFDNGEIKLGTTTGTNNLQNEEPLQINSASGNITNYIQKSAGTWSIKNFTGGEPYMTVTGSSAANVTFGTGQVLVNSTSGVHYKYGAAASAPAFSGLSVTDNPALATYPAKAFQNARITSIRIADKITNNGIGAASGGLQVFDTTTKKLQYWNETDWVELGGGDSIYTADGNIPTSNNRVVNLDGTATLQFTGAANQGDFRIGSSAIGGRSNYSIQQSGDVINTYCYQSNHYVASDSDPTDGGLSAGINYLSVSAQGLEHHKVSVGVGINGTTNDRLVVKGATQTTTKYTARFLDGADNDILTLRDDRLVTLTSPSGLKLTSGSGGYGSTTLTPYSPSNNTGFVINNGNVNFTVGNNGCFVGANSAANAKLRVGGTGATGVNAPHLHIITNTNDTTEAVVVENSDGTDLLNIKENGRTSFSSQVSVGLKSSAAIDGINWDEGNIQEVTLSSGANDFDPTNEVPGSTYILKITQPSSADGTIDWESTTATVNWPGGTAPTLTATNAAVDIITLVCTAANTYYGTSALNFS